MTSVCRWMVAAALCLAPASALAQSMTEQQEAQAQAQQQMPGAGGPGMGPGIGARGGMMGDVACDHYGDMMRHYHDGRGMHDGGRRGAIWDRIDGRISFLRTELKITEQQSAAWTKFADALKAAAARIKEMRQAPRPMSLRDHLERHERLLTQRLENVKALRAAFVPLYDSLSDEQKETAEELLSPYLRR